jgi:hypothetical protein
VVKPLIRLFITEWPVLRQQPMHARIERAPRNGHWHTKMPLAAMTLDREPFSPLQLVAMVNPSSSRHGQRQLSRRRSFQHHAPPEE